MRGSVEQLSGLLLIDKPSGMTSAQVLNSIKRSLKLDRIGHTGTLDPMATGLLLALVGNATRLARFIDYGFKTYSGKIKLGLSTSSDDVTGEVLSISQEVPPFEEVLQAVSHFVGEISQVPPLISAVKVKGERSYKLARQGLMPELSARPVTVKEFLIEPSASDVIRFRITCSRGTYIRSLARDLGKLLGCGGCLKSLRREQVGEFGVNQAKELDKITRHDIVPINEALKSWHHVVLSDEVAAKIKTGDQRALSSEVEKVFCKLVNRSVEPQFAVYSACSDVRHFLGILEKDNNRWTVALNF